MADFITEFSLPSNGKLYNKDVQWRNQLRAPRLKDRGFGDSTRKLRLQANILDKTIVQPLGMSAYDLHTADFVYLNWLQRRLSKGAAPYKISIVCPYCGEQHDIDVPLDSLEVVPLEETPTLEYDTRDDRHIILTYATPRILDESIDRATDFKNEYKETEMSFDTLRMQELLRFLIKKVDGVSLSYPQMTEFISNLFDDDVAGILRVVNDFDFGLQTVKTMNCTKCKKLIRYNVPVGG